MYTEGDKDYSILRSKRRQVAAELGDLAIMLGCFSFSAKREINLSV
jgi:hypothetical protein